MTQNKSSSRLRSCVSESDTEEREEEDKEEREEQGEKIKTGAIVPELSRAPPQHTNKLHFCASDFFLLLLLACDCCRLL